MINFIKKLFGGDTSGKEKPEQMDPPIEYKDFQIFTCPKEVAGGWSTEAKICKTVDGEEHTHHFIRADKTSTRDSAIELTLSKAKMTIDQVGDRLFS